MKTHSRISISVAVAALAAAVLALTQCQAGAKPDEKELVVYCYDSFAAEWGAGPQVVPLFEKAYGCKVTLVSKGDAGQVLAAALLEKAAPKADVVLGLDNQLAPKALAADLLAPSRPANAAKIPAELDFDPSHRLVPFDYGYFCLVWDSRRLPNPPRSLADLAKPEFAKRLIVMDPRSSSPGLGFLAMVLGGGAAAEWPARWAAIKPSIMTVTAGWDAGYGLFTKGEAPLVVSYTTSPAYHVETEHTDRYKALVFAEGLPRQIEAAGVLKNAPHPGLAAAFIDFMLGADFQSRLPLTQWMYPIDSAVALPASFAAAPKPAKTLAVDPASLDKALSEWADVAAR